MRIIAISGRNLASLAGDFRVDFEAEPLAGAGLFAITGETGAGKSTLLDAICLALYGTAPRLEADGSTDTLADVASHKIRSDDPRAILRRGAAQGHAALEFEVGGTRYRASWEVRRAYDKADGQLQNARRTLVRLDDGEVMASGLRDTDAAVHDLVRLTFDQFRRTVLLAQGEFDAFLKADESARAELLERITGTQLFARVSARIFDMEKERRQQIDDLVARLAMVGALATEERAALDAALEEARDGRGELAATREAARKIVDWYGAAERLAEEVAAADAELAKKQAEMDAAAEDRHRLNDLQSVAAVRPAHSAWTKAEAACEAAGQALAQADAERICKSGARVVAEGHAEIAASAAAEAQARFDAAGPDLSRAADLDSRIATAEDRRAAADADLAEKIAARETAEAAFRDVEEKLKALERKAGELDRRLAERAAVRNIAGRLDDIRGTFARRHDLAAEVFEKGEAVERLGKDKTRNTNAASDVERRIGDIENRLKSTRQKSAERRAALNEIDPAGLRARDDALRAADESLGKAVTAVEALRLAQSDAEHHRRAAEAAEKAAAEARDRRDAAGERLQQALARRAEARAGAERGEAALSEQAAALRAALAEGEPCPVCGSTEHPGWDDHGLDRLVEDLRARAAALDAETQKAETEQRDAGAALAAARAEIETSTRLHAETQTRVEAAEAQFAEMRPGLAALAKARGATIDLDRMTPDLEQWLDDERRAIDDERSAARTALKAAEDLQNELGRFESAIEKDTTELGALAADQRRLAAEAQELAAGLARAETETDAAKQGLGAVDAEIGNTLDRAGLGPVDLAREADSGLRALERLVETVLADAAAREQTGGKIEACRTERAAAHAARDFAISAAKESARTAEDSKTALAELVEARAGLFGGLPTDAVRHALSVAAKRGRDRRDRAMELREAARNAANLARQAADAAKNTFADASKTLAAARTELDKALADTGMERAAAERLIDTDNAVAAALAEKLDRLDAALKGAKTTLEDRRSRAAAHAAAPPEIDAEAAGTALAEAEAALAAADTRIGALTGEIARDDQARGTAAELQAELDTLRTEHQAVAAVNQAVGSRDGAKFRRFAQGITLDLLVALASEQLRRIEPRYRLERIGDLGLQVVDREMGDEIRSVRSLSGGEGFLVSLALALALSSLEEGGHFVDTLLIDEGFGSLSANALDTAITALEALQSRGRRVGVISHVEAMHERIPVQVRVEKFDQGRARMRVVDSAAV